MSERHARRRGKTVTNREAVYQAIVDMHCCNPPVPITKSSVAKWMGLDIKLVDLHIDRLFSEDHRLTKPMAGLYVPREVRASRAVNVMAVPGSGGCKLEVGDDVLDLTPWEARMAVGMLQGWLSRFEPAIASKRVRRRHRVAPTAASSGHEADAH